MLQMWSYVPLVLANPACATCDAAISLCADATARRRQVITSAEFHPIECHTFAFASSKGCIRLADLRASALADRAVRTYEEVRRVVVSRI